jgi:NAD(P)-dependent dehydrogenase (short-subunit alcohol dehydrogenase family)
VTKRFHLPRVPESYWKASAGNSGNQARAGADRARTGAGIAHARQPVVNGMARFTRGRSLVRSQVRPWRLLAPDEIAATIRFLASSEASGINGETVTVTLGGLW